MASVDGTTNDPLIVIWEAVATVVLRHQWQVARVPSLLGISDDVGAGYQKVGYVEGEMVRLVNEASFVFVVNTETNV